MDQENEELPENEKLRQKNDELRDFFKHEDEQAAQRTDWLFVGHAILLEAALSSEKDDRRIVVMVLGLAMSLIWLLLGKRQNTNLLWLKERLRKTSKVYEEMLEQREKREQADAIYKCGRAVPIFMHWLPVMFGFVWITLLIWTLIGA